MTYLPGFADLLWLADHAADITEAKHKGTARPWQQPADLTPTQRREADERAIVERRERDAASIGEHPAPLHLDVLDLLVDLLSTSDDIAEQVSQAAGVDRLPYPTSALADPEPYLRHAATHLSMAYEADPSLPDGVAEDAARLRASVARHLREVQDGQVVPGLCPWCQGGIEARRTLRIRMVRPAPGLDFVPAAVCESGVCEPPESDVGAWHRNHPAWPLDTEGDWLSKRIAHRAKDGPCCRAPRPTEEDPDAVCGEPILPTGNAGRPATAYCSAACRRAADAARRRNQREAS